MMITTDFLDYVLLYIVALVSVRLWKNCVSTPPPWKPPETNAGRHAGTQVTGSALWRPKRAARGGPRRRRRRRSRRTRVCPVVPGNAANGPPVCLNPCVPRSDADQNNIPRVFLIINRSRARRFWPFTARAISFRFFLRFSFLSNSPFLIFFSPRTAFFRKRWTEISPLNRSGLLQRSPQKYTGK